MSISFLGSQTMHIREYTLLALERGIAIQKVCVSIAERILISCIVSLHVLHVLVCEKIAVIDCF